MPEHRTMHAHHVIDPGASPSPRVSRAWRVALACVATMVLGGCGETSEPGLTSSQYKQRVEQIAEQAGGPPAADPSDPVSAMRDVAEQLDVIGPPEEVADAHRMLVAGLRRMAAALDDQPAATAPRNDAVSESLAALEELEGAADDIGRADRMFRTRGYDVSSITGTHDAEAEREALATLVPARGSSVRGLMRLVPHPTSWDLVLELDGAGNLPSPYAFVVATTCDKLADTPLAERDPTVLQRPQADGSTTSDLAPEDVQAWRDGGHAVVIHADDDFTRHAACADIPPQH